MKGEMAREVTVSGHVAEMYRRPDGEMDWLPAQAWKSDPPLREKINVLALESFRETSYPIVSVTCRRKDVSKLYEWFWKDWDSSKVYDVNVVKTGEKKLTRLTFVSGRTMLVDEDVSVFKDALNGLTGSAA